MRAANNSIHYYFCGPEEREKEVACDHSPYGPAMDIGDFNCMLEDLKRTNPTVKHFSSANEWDAEDVDFHIAMDGEDGPQTCRVDVCSVVERPQSSIPTHVKLCYSRGTLLPASKRR